jgi:hypothetical protein
VKRTARIALGAVALSAVTGLISTGVAMADPSGSPTYRVLAGEGSDTTEGVMNGLSNVVLADGSAKFVDSTGAPLAAGTKVLASYNAVGGAFQSKAASNCAYTANPTPNSSYVNGARANGSGNGRNALRDAYTAGSSTQGCLNYARSSAVGGALTGVPTTYIPFAKDGVAYAVTGTTNLSRSYSLADLKTIYNCQGDPSITAYLPQAGSGTRSFWEGAMGITDAQVTSGALSCIKDTKNGVPVEEHDGRVLDDNSIAPFSIAQYVAQGAGTIADKRGKSVLGVVNGSLPVNLNSGYGAADNTAVTRLVYNVVPTSTITGASADPNAVNTFVGSGSALCAQSATIQAYGFAPIANCGDTSVTK